MPMRRPWEECCGSPSWSSMRKCVRWGEWRTAWVSSSSTRHQVLASSRATTRCLSCRGTYSSRPRSFLHSCTFVNVVLSYSVALNDALYRPWSLVEKKDANCIMHLYLHMLLKNNKNWTFLLSQHSLTRLQVIINYNGHLDENEHVPWPEATPELREAHVAGGVPGQEPEGHDGFVVLVLQDKQRLQLSWQLWNLGQTTHERD